MVHAIHEEKLPRFSELQKGRTLVHPTLSFSSKVAADVPTPQKTTSPPLRPYTFVVCSDAQIGMTSGNREWETELEYSRQAIAYINSLDPRPLFCCICGDMVDMEKSFFAGDGFSTEECDNIQDQQNADFQKTWSALHEDIVLVCLCGNHGASLLMQN